MNLPVSGTQNPNVSFFEDFQKLHQANFNKMESIDSYLQRKTKKLETYRGSAKDSKVKLIHVS